MYPALVGVLYLPVAVWVATAVGLLLAVRRAAPRVVLRLAATFLALWALLATTTVAWVLANGGWSAIVSLAASPGRIFEPVFWALWVAGAIGAFGVFLVAFLLNQLVGRGFLRILRPRPMPWPSRLPVPRVETRLLVFPSESLEAFSFALLVRGSSGLLGRREFILLSARLRDRLEPDELEAAIAHELGHLRSLDGRYLTFMRTLARLMRWDPVIAYLAYSLTRREEYRADTEAVQLTRRPLALARALFKVSALPESDVPASALGFLGGVGARRDVAERIRRLVELAESPEFARERDGPG